MRSSPSSTANGSSPTCCAAHEDGVAEAARVALADVVDVGEVGRLPAPAASRSASPLASSACLELEARSKWSSSGALVAAGDHQDVVEAGARRPPRRRTGSPACRRPAASPWASPWSPAGTGCRGRRRGSPPWSRCIPRTLEGRPTPAREGAGVRMEVTVATDKADLRVRLRAARTERSADERRPRRRRSARPRARAARGRARADRRGVRLARRPSRAPPPLLHGLTERGVRVLLPVLLDGLLLDWADVRGARRPGALRAAGQRVAAGAARRPAGPGRDRDRRRRARTGPRGRCADGTRMGFGGGCYDRALALMDAVTPVGGAAVRRGGARRRAEPSRTTVG